MIIASVAAPWLIADYYLKPVGSHPISLIELREDLARDLTGSTVIIGDCTISPLDKKQIQTAWRTDVRVLGFGGSMVKEWYYFIKNNFDKFATAKHVIVGTSHPTRFSYLVAPYTSFLPYFMTWKDIYEYSVVEKKIYFSETLRFMLGKVFEAYPASQELRYRLFMHLVPDYHPWHEEKNKLFGATETWRSQVRHNPMTDLNLSTDEHEYFQKLAEISRKMNGRLIYMLTPREDRMVTTTFLQEKRDWLEKCRELGVRCVDMSRSMPDADFGGSGDGLHLMFDESLRVYGRKIEDMLKQLR